MFSTIVLGGADDVGRAAGGGDADDDVLARGAAAGDVALADLGRVFVHIRGARQSLRAPGHDVLHLLRRGGEGGRALGGVQRGDADRAAGADVDETSAVAEAAGDGVDDLGDLGQRLLDGGGYLGVFMIDDAGDFDGGFGVETFRCLIGPLRGEALEVGGRARERLFYGFLKGHSGHRPKPEF